MADSTVYNIRHFRVRLMDPNRNQIYANGNQQIGIVIELQVTRSIDNGPSENILISPQDIQILLRSTDMPLLGKSPPWQHLPPGWFQDNRGNDFQPAGAALDSAQNASFLPSEAGGNEPDNGCMAVETHIAAQADAENALHDGTDTPSAAVPWQIFHRFLRTTARHQETFSADILLAVSGNQEWETSAGSIGNRSTVTVRPVPPPHMPAQALQHVRQTIFREGVPEHSPTHQRWELYLDSWIFPLNSYRIQSIQLVTDEGEIWTSRVQHLRVEQHMFKGIINASINSLSVADIVHGFPRSRSWPARTFHVPQTVFRAYDLFETGTPDRRPDLFVSGRTVRAKVTDVMGNEYFYRLQVHWGAQANVTVTDDRAF